MKQSTSNLEAQTLKQNAEAKLSSVDAVLTLAEVSAILNISLEATKQLFDTGSICFCCQIRNAGSEHWRGVGRLSH